MKKHLDLGCGMNPRNPFNADELFGIDIAPPENGDDKHFKVANLNIEAIPFPDNHFDSVSAYDFLEHIMRAGIYKEKTIFPFVELMNEIHRVLKPGGEFYALTPYYPKEASFIDPTHVNFITKKTHSYFVAPEYKAARYGYTGKFEALRVKTVNAALEKKPKWRFARSLWMLVRPLFPSKKTKLYGKQHLVWHFKKIA